MTFGELIFAMSIPSVMIAAGCALSAYGMWKLRVEVNGHRLLTIEIVKGLEN